MALIQIGGRPDHGFDEPLGLLSDCHRRIEHFLATLIAIEHDLAGGDLTAPNRASLESALTYFATAAPKHTADEEESLFPRLRRSADAAAAQALEVVDRLERDHDVAERHHQAVDRLGRRWLTEGSLRSAECAELRGHLSALQAIYRDHITVEDRDLFPAAARLLPRHEIDAIGREMAARRRP